MIPRARPAGPVPLSMSGLIPFTKGKGYALGYLLHELKADIGESGYDGFFVFDADNIIAPNFVNEMNKVFDTGDYQALTSYRNSKNFADNWISAGYGLWFMREARFLNFPRNAHRYQLCHFGHRIPDLGGSGTAERRLALSSAHRGY